MVVKTNKNLGPGIIECNTYVQKALSEHLLDHKMYRKLDKWEAHGRIIGITKIVHRFLDTWKGVLDPKAIRFIRGSLTLADPFPHFISSSKYTRPQCGQDPLSALWEVSCMALDAGLTTSFNQFVIGFRRTLQVRLILWRPSSHCHRYHQEPDSSQ